MNLPNCPRCNTTLVERAVEGRIRQECPDCSYLNYLPRRVTGGYECFADDIIDEVAKSGVSNQLTVGLINTIFRDGDRGRTSQQLIDDWCDLHELIYQTYLGPDAHGKERQWIRFTRRPKS
jgi:hypothetical protein